MTRSKSFIVIVIGGMRRSPYQSDFDSLFSLWLFIFFGVVKVRPCQLKTELRYDLVNIGLRLATSTFYNVGIEIELYGCGGVGCVKVRI